MADVQIDFLALSFVRGPDVIHSVRSYVDSQLERRHPGHSMEIVAKIEAYDSVVSLPEIIDASDAIMVARSDLGAQIPLEDVPAVQKEIVFRCRQVCRRCGLPLRLLWSTAAAGSHCHQVLRTERTVQ